MLDRNVLRLGGICGLLFVILFIPSYVSAPDTPSTASSIQQVLDYFISGQSQIVFLNGVLLIFASFFFLWFLGILHALLQHAEHDGYAFGSVTLIGGLLFVTLMLAGAAIEIVHPATQARFANFHSDAQLGFVSLALSGWMYRFAFVGMATLITARRSSGCEPASCRSGWSGPVGYAPWWRCCASSARWAAGSHWRGSPRSPS